MQYLKLKNSITLSVNPIGSEEDAIATYLIITSLDINISENINNCKITYQIGNIKDDKFIPINDSNKKDTYTAIIEGDDFITLAHTTISPSEKSLSIYDILKSRIIGYLKSKDIL